MNWNSQACADTVFKTQIRHHRMQHRIMVYTVCHSSSNFTHIYRLLNGLVEEKYMVKCMECEYFERIQYHIKIYQMSPKFPMKMNFELKGKGFK